VWITVARRLRKITAKHAQVTRPLAVYVVGVLGVSDCLSVLGSGYERRTLEAWICGATKTTAREDLLLAHALLTSQSRWAERRAAKDGVGR
jgi:hypothetical protein